jgi:hypothetical protein
MIGQSFPLGNTWDVNASAIEKIEAQNFSPFVENFELENNDIIQATTKLEPEKPSSSAPFEPIYGWTGIPILFTIASMFSSTITELKFCGFSGSPILRRPLSNTRIDITPGLLHHLRYFDNLKQLVLSIYIPRTGGNMRAHMITDWRNRPPIFEGNEEGDPQREAMKRTVSRHYTALILISYTHDIK